MTWTTPVIVEICIGLEINGYLPAEFGFLVSSPWLSCRLAAALAGCGGPESNGASFRTARIGQAEQNGRGKVSRSQATPPRQTPPSWRLCDRQFLVAVLALIPMKTMIVGAGVPRIISVQV
jgi:coenzyme PQQ precursor peptide PqqA